MRGTCVADIVNIRAAADKEIIHAETDALDHELHVLCTGGQSTVHFFSHLPLSHDISRRTIIYLI